MAKDPAFLFYSQDFIVGVQTMSMEDRGKYITILAQMHQQGRMSEETICFLVGSVSVSLKNKFLIDEDGLWYNKRLEEETEKRKKYIESRTNNGIRGGRPKKEVKNHMDNHMPNHTEDENEDVNKDKKETKNTRKQKKQESKVDYGFGVLLTDKEHAKLLEDYGTDITTIAIEKLGLYKQSSGKTYKSDYAAILNWGIKRAETELAEKRKLSRPGIDTMMRMGN